VKTVAGRVVDMDLKLAVARTADGLSKGINIDDLNDFESSI